MKLEDLEFIFNNLERCRDDQKAIAFKGLYDAFPKLIAVAKAAKGAICQIGCKFDHPDCPVCMLMDALADLKKGPLPDRVRFE